MRSLRPLLCSLFFLLAATLTSVADATTGENAEAATKEQAAPEIVASVEVELLAEVQQQLREGDKHETCAEWAKSGECQNNPGFMTSNCAASCTDEAPQEEAPKRAVKAQAYVRRGEDAAVGAFRFAEDYNADDVEQVLQVAHTLHDQLLASESYTPPPELTHCNNKKCSAGKLWKRAEEMRKADMHDAAGADLLRALLKTGIETDFIQRCQRSLQWALGSISRQREREARQAIEDAKLEKRRQEERDAMDEAMQRKAEYEADFVKFGVQLQESLANPTASATVGADGSVEAAAINAVTASVKQTFVKEGPQGGNWNECIQLIKKIPGSEKTIDVLLIEARCHESQGNHKSALSAAGRLIQKAANYDPWVNDSPRMMAATLGANAAMQLGLSENALSFYQTVLKFDPEQARARKQYRGLKKVVKLMDKAEEQIQKGYNKAASVHVDDCLSAMRGLDVDSPLFRSKIQLKQCTIMSGMAKYEEALENCDTAVELRIGNDSVSPASRKEAHLARAEALLLDMDYDEAVQDFRAALELVPEDDQTGEKRELQQKLRSTMHQQEMWNGGKKDHRFNENTGFPDGMPPQRDHAKILQLPIDLGNREKDVKCAWLKKQFKFYVRKYHPDKYKGNKKRAARKFKEVKEAKDIISSQWEC